jgi:hypothetical protein
MSTDVYGNWTEGGQLSQQLLSVGSIGVVRLVIAKITPNRRERSVGLIGVDLNVDARRRKLQPGKNTEQEQKNARDKQAGQPISGVAMAGREGRLRANESRPKDGDNVFQHGIDLPRNCVDTPVDCELTSEVNVYHIAGPLGGV